MVSSACILITQDTLLPNSSTSLAAGTYLDPWDLQLGAMPSAAQLNQCSPAPIVSVVFFCVFVVLCGMIMINLVVGVILDNFESSLHDEELQVRASTPRPHAVHEGTTA
jgi:hypothetical protein